MSKSPMYWLVSLIAAMLIGLIAAYATMRPGTGRPTQALPLTDPVAYEGMQIIPFEMVDQNGNTQNQEILQGHWTVMSFMFTHCVLACPTLQGNVYRLAESPSLSKLPVRFVSISVDPKNDTVQRLNQYATDMGVDYERWKLLRGDEALVQHFMTALGFVPPREDNNPDTQITLPDGSTMGNILHPNSFLVINPDGKVVGRYRGDDPEEIQQLAVDLQRAIRG